MVFKFKKKKNNLNKLLNNDISSLMILLFSLDLRNAFLTSVSMGASLYYFIFILMIYCLQLIILVYHMRNRFLSNNFEMKNMKEATYVIRIEIF